MATSSTTAASRNAAASSDLRWLPEFVLLAVLWGASFLFMRLGAAQFGPVPTAGLRVSMAALFLLPVMVLRGEWPALRQHWKPVLFSGLINSAIPFALFAYAVVQMPTGMATEVQQALANLPQLDKLIAMREELRALWTRTNVSAEQLVHDLQEWCHRAESSGIAALQEFSRKLRAAHA